MTALAIILFLLLALIAMVLLQYLMRENRIGSVRFIGDDGDDHHLDASDDLFRETFERLTNSRIYDSNSVEILLNGEQTYPRLFEDLRAAREIITFHVYWMTPGRLVDELRSILSECARRGVKVFVLIDYYGAKGVRDRLLRDLRDAGAEVELFRPLQWNLLYKVQHRMHIRAVVIDGKLGYTGGFGIDDRWMGNGVGGAWRDTNVRLQGPVVDQLQAAFIENWGESTGELLVGPALFRTGEDAGDVACGIVHTAPALGSTNAERYFVLSISAAKQRLWITNPYFVPDDDFRSLLDEACRRGVDVRVLNPGTNNDETKVMWASHGLYEELLESGVRIFEYEPSMIHAKTLVVDGALFSVGSINFDNRSVMLNDEVTLVGHDQRLAKQLEEIFLRDLERAREITLEEFRNRGRVDRMKERLARSIDKFF